MIKLKALLETEYNPEWDYTVDTRPIRQVKKLVEDILKELTPLKRALRLKNVRIHFITGDKRGALARYINGTRDNPHFVMSTRVIYRASKKYGVNLGLAIYITLVHEFCHAYLEMCGIDVWVHDEDLIEEVARDYNDDSDVKKLKSRLDLFAKDTNAHYFIKRHKLKEIEYPLAKGKEIESPYAAMEGWIGKVIWMTPDKFLSLTPTLFNPNPASLKYLEKKIKRNIPIDSLMLWVNIDTNTVISHEGRHRAETAKKLGIKKIPVMVIIYSPKLHHSGGYLNVPSWTKQQHDYINKAEFMPQSGKNLKEIYKGGIPRYLYHATFWELTPSIFEKGIVSGGTQYINFIGNDPGVYLTPDKNLAVSFVETSENEEIPKEWFDEIVILTIDLRKLDNKKLFEKDPHWNVGKKVSKSFLYKGVIPPSAVIKMEDEHGHILPMTSSSQLGLT